MAELCKDCYQRLYGTKDKLIMSGPDDLDLCEECGEAKEVVVRVKLPPHEALITWWDNLGYRLRSKLK